MTTVAVLGACGVAAGATAHKTGDYVAGHPGPKSGTGVRIHFGANRFSVKLIRYQEHCNYGNSSFNEPVAFRRDKYNKLEGKINDNGDFSGKYVTGANTFKVSGHVEGHKATVKSNESGIYNPASTKQPNECHGKHTFHAALAQ